MPSHAQAEAPIWLTQGEVARRLGCGISTVERLRRAGELPYRPGRPVMIRADAVDACLRNCLAARVRRQTARTRPVPEIEPEQWGRLLALRVHLRETDDLRRQGAILAEIARIKSPDERIRRAERREQIAAMLRPQPAGAGDDPRAPGDRADERPSAPDLWLTQAEVATILRRSISNVERLRNAGDLPYRPGRPVMIHARAVRAYEERAEVCAHRVEAAPPDPRLDPPPVPESVRQFHEGQALARRVLGLQEGVPQPRARR